MTKGEAYKIMRKHGLCSCRKHLFAASACEQSSCDSCNLYVTDDELREASSVIANAALDSTLQV